MTFPFFVALPGMLLAICPAVDICCLPSGLMDNETQGRCGGTSCNAIFSVVFILPSIIEAEGLPLYSLDSIGDTYIQWQYGGAFI